MTSRSLRNFSLVAARGASCEDAKLMAGVMSELGADVQFRISSINCNRNKAKCNAGSLSSIFKSVSDVRGVANR